jgi:1A family penicillin-binding protein
VALEPARKAKIFAVISGLLIAAFAGSLLYFWSAGVFESEDEQIKKLTAAIIPDNSIVLDRAGNKIGEYYNHFHVEVAYKDIPQGMVNALLAIEDRKFFEHEGVNWKSMFRALISIVSSGRLKQGGSTITMQLVKNYLLTREKKVSRKLREIILSYYVEKNLSKERILELYLNTMYMGHGAYGVGAASIVYFGRPLNELSLAEFSLLAGLFQAPSAFDPHRNPQGALRRQKVVLDALLNAKLATKDEIESARQKVLEFKPWTPINETIAPFFVSWIRSEVGTLLGEDDTVLNDRGYRITTTLDKNFQELANKAVLDNLGALDVLQTKINSNPKKKTPERIEAALLASDPKTGAVLAMVGGRNFRESQFNRAVSAKRSPGSVFKPVVFSLALERGMVWSDLVYASPVAVGKFRPKNHKGDDMTEATLIKALARSLNTPVISLAQKYGMQNVIERAELMGVRSPMKLETGVAIGGFSATMFDVDAIYRTMANLGLRHESHAITKIEDRDGNILFSYDAATQDPIQALSPNVAELLRSGLQAVLSHGTASSIAHMAGYAAGKTGTSDDSRDNWFAGYTKDIVATVWVGGDNHSPLGDAASGTSLALPMWRGFIEGLVAAGLPAVSWPIPDSMVAVTIDPDYGNVAEQGVSALFPENKKPKKSQAAADMRTLKTEKGAYRELKLGD